MVGVIVVRFSGIAGGGYVLSSTVEISRIGWRARVRHIVVGISIVGGVSGRGTSFSRVLVVVCGDIVVWW